MNYPQAHGQPRVPGVWTCPYCAYQGAPKKSTKVSTTGWVVCIVLVFLCFVLFWIGLLMTETITLCPACKTKI